MALIKEIHGSVGLGQGALYTSGMDIENLLAIDLKKLNKTYVTRLGKALAKLSKREIGSIFEEIGANSSEEVSLDKVKPDRRELDKIIMGEILGLTDEEQLEVYKAVVDLVKARIERAESVKKRKKTMDVDIEALVDSALKDVKGLKRFPEDFVQAKRDFKVVEIPEGAVKAGSDLHGYYVQVGEEKIRCNSPEEAMYIQYAAGNGHRRIEVPLDEKILKKAVKEYGKLLKDAEKIITEFVESSISSKKLREKVKREAWRRLGIHS